MASVECAVNYQFEVFADTITWLELDLMCHLTNRPLAFLPHVSFAKY